MVQQLGVSVGRRSRPEGNAPTGCGLDGSPSTLPKEEHQGWTLTKEPLDQITLRKSGMKKTTTPERSKFIPCPNCGTEVKISAIVLDCPFCGDVFLTDWQTRRECKES